MASKSSIIKFIFIIVMLLTISACSDPGGGGAVRFYDSNLNDVAAGIKAIVVLCPENTKDSYNLPYQYALDSSLRQRNLMPQTLKNWSGGGVYFENNRNFIGGLLDPGTIHSSTSSIYNDGWPTGMQAYGYNNLYTPETAWSNTNYPGGMIHGKHPGSAWTTENYCARGDSNSTSKWNTMRVKPNSNSWTNWGMWGAWTFRGPIGDARNNGTFTPKNPSVGISNFYSRFHNRHGSNASMASGWESFIRLYSDNADYFGVEANGTYASLCPIFARGFIGTDHYDWNAATTSWARDTWVPGRTSPWGGADCAPLLTGTSYDSAVVDSVAPNIVYYDNKYASPRRNFRVELFCNPGNSACNNQERGDGIYSSISGAQIELSDRSRPFLFINDGMQYNSSWQTNLLRGEWVSGTTFLNWSAGDAGLGIESASGGGESFGGTGVDSGMISIDQSGTFGYSGQNCSTYTFGASAIEGLPTKNPSSSTSDFLMGRDSGTLTKPFYRAMREQTNPSSPNSNMYGTVANSGVCGAWFYKNKTGIDTTRVSDGVKNITMCSQKASSGSYTYSLGTGAGGCAVAYAYVDNTPPVDGISIINADNKTLPDAFSNKWVRGTIYTQLNASDISSGIMGGYNFIRFGDTTSAPEALSQLNNFKLWYVGSGDTALQNFGIVDLAGLLSGSINAPYEMLENSSGYGGSCKFTSAVSNMRCETGSGAPEGTYFNTRLRTIDIAGNATSSDLTEWRVDNTPPSFAQDSSTGAQDSSGTGVYTTNGTYKKATKSDRFWTSGPFKAKFNAIDGGSGVNSMQYCKVEVLRGEQQSYSGSTYGGNSLSDMEALADLKTNLCQINDTSASAPAPITVLSANFDNSSYFQEQTPSSSMLNSTGIIQYTVKAVDAAGNWAGQSSGNAPLATISQGWKRMGTVYVDGDAPTVGLGGASPGDWTNCSIPADCSITMNPSDIGSGLNSLQVKYESRIDFSSPDVRNTDSKLRVGDTITTEQTQEIAESDRENQSGSNWWLNVPGTTPWTGSGVHLSPVNNSFKKDFSEPGDRKLTFRLTDNANNETSQEVPMRIDKEEPELTITNIKEPIDNPNILNMTISATDPAYDIQGTGIMQAQSGLDRGYFEICMNAPGKCSGAAPKNMNSNGDTVPDINGWMRLDQSSIVANGITNKCVAVWDNITSSVEGISPNNSPGDLQPSKDWAGTYSCQMSKNDPRIAEPKYSEYGGDSVKYSFRFIAKDVAGNEAISSLVSKNINNICLIDTP